MSCLRPFDGEEDVAQHMHRPLDEGRQTAGAYIVVVAVCALVPCADDDRLAYIAALVVHSERRALYPGGPCDLEARPVPLAVNGEERVREVVRDAVRAGRHTRAAKIHVRADHTLEPRSVDLVPAIIAKLFVLQGLSRIYILTFLLTLRLRICIGIRAFSREGRRYWPKRVQKRVLRATFRCCHAC